MLAALLATATARGGGGPASDVYDDIRAHVALDGHLLADVYVQHDFNAPPSGTVQLRAFDQAAGPSLGYLGFTLAHRPGRLGFRIDAGVGDLADDYAADDPLSATHPEAARMLGRIQQAFVSVVVPLGRGLHVDAGKFDTPDGLEDNRSVSNWNYSRALIFEFAEPSVHSGLRVTYEVTEALAFSAFWLDGWNSNFGAGDGMRAWAAAGRWKPRPSLTLTIVYLGGWEHAPDQPLLPTTLRHAVDVTLEYTLGRLRLALSGDYGHDAARGGIDFGGVAGYARLAIASWLATALRGEVLLDPTGFMTGARQTVGEATLTLEARARTGPRPRQLELVGRVEYRHDRSTAPVFEAADGMRSAQDTLTLALAAFY